MFIYDIYVIKMPCCKSYE